MKRYYNVVIVPGVGPELFGPYDTEGTQRAGALDLVLHHPDVGLEGDAPLYWLETDPHSPVSMGQHSLWYMDTAREQARVLLAAEKPQEPADG